MINVVRDATNRPRGYATRSRQLLSKWKKARRQQPLLRATTHWVAIRKTLRDEAAILASVFADKCAYCESVPGAVSRPHVEHYRPKSNPQFEDLMFEWTNWLLSCGRCNESKWRHFPTINGIPALLDPTADEPRDHVNFIDAYATGLTERGEQTILLVGLNRSALVEQRELWLGTVSTLALLLLTKWRDEARAQLSWAMGVDAPYSAMTRAFVKATLPAFQPTVKSGGARPIALLIEKARAELRAVVVPSAPEPVVAEVGPEGT